MVELSWGQGHSIPTDNLCPLLQGFKREHGMFFGVLIMRISACLLLWGISVKKLPLSTPDAKEGACQSSWVSKREACPLKKRKSTQAVCIAGPLGKPFYLVLIGPVPGTGDREAQIRSFKSFNSRRQWPSREGWEINTNNGDITSNDK